MTCLRSAVLANIAALGPVTGPVTALRSVVLVQGQRQQANTAVQGSVTAPITNFLINDKFMN